MLGRRLQGTQKVHSLKSPILVKPEHYHHMFLANLAVSNTLTDYRSKNDNYGDDVSCFTAAEVVKTLHTRTVFHFSILRTQLRKIWHARSICRQK